jgi:hypothetical protein
MSFGVTGRSYAVQAEVQNMGTERSMHHAIEVVAQLSHQFLKEIL